MCISQILFKKHKTDKLESPPLLLLAKLLLGGVGGDELLLVGLDLRLGLHLLDLQLLAGGLLLLQLLLQVLHVLLELFLLVVQLSHLEEKLQLNG